MIHWNKKLTIGLVLALIMALVVVIIALADQITGDADALALDAPHSNSLSATQNGGKLVEYDFSAYIKETGNASDNVFPGTVNVTVTASGDWLKSVTGNLSFTAYNVSSNGKITINVPCGMAGTSKTMTVVLTAGTSSDGNSLNPNSITLSYVITAGPNELSCAPSDTTNPVLLLPSNMTIEATSASGATATFIATADDANPQHPVVNCNPASGSTFALGTATVDCSATDAAGNTGSGSFSISVVDTTPPVITAHGDETAEATSAAGAVVNYTAPATSDIVDGAGTATCTPASGSQFALGNTTVTCNASDTAGNDATPTTFVVHVVDTTPPTITFVNRLPAANSFGWNNDDVTVNWSCTDLVGVKFATVSISVSAEGKDQTATGTCEDTSGNKASDIQTGINIDKTAPTISGAPDRSANGNGWYNADVTITFTCSDTLSGVASCSSPTSLGDGSNQSVTGTATDNAGNTATATVSGINIDKTAPTISGAPDRPANGNGWYNADVTITFTCGDALSGVSSCTAPTTLGEGAGQSVSGSVTDKAGNSASIIVTGINIDKTAPTASTSASPAANANGWNNTNVTVSFSGTDSLSGIASCSTDVVLSTEGAGQWASGTCTDKAGNVSSLVTASDINIDKTAPTASASASPAANANGWNNTDVTVSFNGTDDLSEIASCSPDVVLSAEGAGQSASGTCTDKAGNVSASATASSINIDKTPPTVSLVGGPANGGSYYFGSVPAAPTCSASDALSDLDGICSVSGYGTTVGSHTVTATAKDKAGNTASASATYSVLAWTLKGFYQPVDMNGVYNSVKNGSTVPLKLEIFSGTTELTDIASVKSLTYAQTNCDANATTDDIETTATGGTSLRYDTIGGQFVYNWKTPATAGKCYRVTMTTQDGSSLVAYFKLK